MPRYEVNPLAQIPESPVALFDLIYRNRDREKKAFAIRRRLDRGESCADALAAEGERNVWYCQPNALPDTRKWLARLEGRVLRVTKQKAWGDNEFMFDLYTALCCMHVGDRKALRRRRLELRWDDATDGPVYARTGRSLKTYPPEVQAQYERAYALLSARVENGKRAEDKRRTHWRKHLRDISYRELSEMHDPETGEGIGLDEVHELLGFRYLYYIANGFEWNSVWEMATNLAIADQKEN